MSPKNLAHQQNMELGSYGPPRRGTHGSRDAAVLARLGKKPVLKRNFGFMTILGFSCAVLITWEATVTVFLQGFQNGGPAGLVYGYLVVWAGTISTFATMSELASMMPTSGGQYFWVSVLAPKSSRKFAGYLIGWLTITGWQSLVASGGFVTGTMIQGLILLNHPEYLSNMQNWHGTMLFWGVVLAAFSINTIFGKLLSRFEGFILILHILGFFAILLPLVFMSKERSDAQAVFLTWLNLGEWQTQGLSFCIGSLGTVFAFLGADGAIHMAEEIRNASVVIPRSILTGITINGSLGLAMLIAMLFCMGDIDAALEENPLYPFMAIFKNVTGSTAGATVMAAIVVIMSVSATTGILASTSRLYWSFARDHGLPASSFLSKTSARTNVPTRAVITTTVIAIILSLVNIGNATAFNGVISISIAGLFGSYLIVTALLLYRRITGAIRLPSPDDDDLDLANALDSPLVWGPWRLPGVLGIVNNMFACAYLIFIFFFAFWPAVNNPDVATMNWAVLVFGVVIIFSVVYYLVWARKIYTGPIVEV
ncbi:hypothetical protein KVR01_001963 [Diaporthe batatas]|uniref:uncharacterized protein n=1 Tax=Diaporthe batatas TaxID=748121 RepID=UPI001D04CB94|nr:uncharacterized protein KVR01_001963 [Diaporthe batatas]KAG8169214.1 hypothetical protein KVR01_001963 [Diaporthe batatas]